jgi:hypothetical protein
MHRLPDVSEKGNRSRHTTQACRDLPAVLHALHGIHQRLTIACAAVTIMAAWAAPAVVSAIGTGLGTISLGTASQMLCMFAPVFLFAGTQVAALPSCTCVKPEICSAAASAMKNATVVWASRAGSIGLHVGLLAQQGSFVVPALLPALGNVAFIGVFSAVQPYANGAPCHHPLLHQPPAQCIPIVDDMLWLSSQSRN